jgi:hypothetical protein
MVLLKCLEKVGDNDDKINVPPYMHIHLVVNVENLKLCWFSILSSLDCLKYEIEICVGGLLAPYFSILKDFIHYYIVHSLFLCAH